ncbi:MAG: bifunctional hydroxymethylpyrimidine kinase/phosphomethylpyrimidine kinase [Actinobacteria bacterium]|nr:bifunctional hydroxymethylpyrimidine kinase/phosphomethylpyrimidine kinase [Actinomycetota bacterium]
MHVHAGGQGLWISRMARSLGADVVVCGPFGGETGDLAAHLAAQEELQVRATRFGGSSGSYVHDRRRGERAEIVRIDQTPLGRHDLDDLYGTVLVESLDADVVVLGGAEPADVIPADFFGRLAEDLHAAGRTVVADLSGEATRAVLGSGLDVLKMSHTEMHEGSFAASAGRDDLLAGARRMIADGVGAVVVSRSAEPTMLVTAHDEALIKVPQVTTVDHHGAGDSMTAAIAVGMGRGLSLVDAAALGAAAGALNVTRRGLGTGHGEQIERFAREVTVTPARGSVKDGTP